MTPMQLQLLVKAQGRVARAAQGGAVAPAQGNGTTVGTVADFAQLAALAARSVRG
jgi:hypothetical protein